MRPLAILLYLMLPLAAADAADIHIATWNLEWLVSPDTGHASRRACDRGKRGPLPCDVARRIARDSADYARLAAYARQLDADVIAFQEVEDVATAARVFRGYRICLAGGTGVQHVGFAVRTRLPHRCEAHYSALAISRRDRPGALLTLLPGRPDAIRLLGVHLKSGCATDALDSGRPACNTLAAQAQALAQWIDAQRDSRFILLGDFNRAGPAAEDPFWRLLHRDAATELHNAAAGATFHNCHAGQPFWQFIDHILVSPSLTPRIVRGSFSKRGYRGLDALRYRLSDHCPVSIKLHVNAPIAGY